MSNNGFLASDFYGWVKHAPRFAFGPRVLPWRHGWARDGETGISTGDPLGLLPPFVKKGPFLSLPARGHIDRNTKSALRAKLHEIRGAVAGDTGGEIDLPCQVLAHRGGAVAGPLIRLEPGVD